MTAGTKKSHFIVLGTSYRRDSSDLPRIRWRSSHYKRFAIYSSCASDGLAAATAKTKNRCGRAGEWKRATEIFDEARYVRRIRPSLQIYGALISSLAGGEKWAEVLTYIDRMAADGVVPDAAATNTGVLAAAELGDGRLALTLLEGKQWRLRDDAGGDGQKTCEGVADGDTLDEAGGRGRERGEEGAAVASAGAAAAAAATVTPFDNQPGDVGRPGVGAGEGRFARGDGGWEAATPGLLNSVLHALDGTGEDTAVLEAVKRGRDEGVLLNASIYR